MMSPMDPFYGGMHPPSPHPMSPWYSPNPMYPPGAYFGGRHHGYSASVEPYPSHFPPLYSGLYHPPIFHGEPLPDPISPRAHKASTEGDQKTEECKKECEKECAKSKPEGYKACPHPERKGSNASDSAEINPRAFDTRVPPPLGHHRFASPHSMMYSHPPAYGHPLYFQPFNTMSPFFHSPFHGFGPVGCPCCPPCCPPIPHGGFGTHPPHPNRQHQHQQPHGLFQPSSVPTTLDQPSTTHVPPVKEVDTKQEEDKDEKKDSKNLEEKK